MYRIATLFSGSGGNAIFVDTGNAKLLFDAGKSTRAITNALSELGVGLKEIDGVFITHEHVDHIGALPVLHKKISTPIHMTRASYENTALPPHDSFVLHPPVFCQRVGGTDVISFPTSHDSAMSVGYRIEWIDEEGHRHAIGIATDTGYVSDAVREGLMGCEAVVLEANHDPDMLMTGPYPYPLKMRILSRTGHLANEDCAAFSRYLAENGTRRLLLAHLSRENNTPQRALSCVEKAVEGYGVILRVADPFSPVLLIP